MANSGYIKIQPSNMYIKRSSAIAPDLNQLSVDPAMIGQDMEKSRAKQMLANLSADLNEVDRRNIEWFSTYTNEHKGGQARAAADAYQQHFQQMIGDNENYGMNLQAKYADHPEAASILHGELGVRLSHGYASALKYQTEQNDIFIKEQSDLVWENHRATLNSGAFDHADTEQSLQDAITMTSALNPAIERQSITRELTRRDRGERVRAGINSRQWDRAEEQLNRYREEIDPDEYDKLQASIEGGRNRDLREVKLFMSATESMGPGSLQSIMESGEEVQGAREDVAKREQLGVAPQGALEDYDKRVEAAHRYHKAVNSDQAFDLSWREREEKLAAEFSTEAGSAQDSQERKMWDMVYDEFNKQRQAFANDPVQYNAAAVQDIINRQQYSGLEGEELAAAKRRGIRLPFIWKCSAAPAAGK